MIEEKETKVFLFKKDNITSLKGELTEDFKKIFLTLKEAIEFSGVPIRNLSIFFDGDSIHVVEKEEDLYLIYGGSDIDIDKIIEEVSVKEITKTVEAPKTEEFREKVGEKKEEIISEVKEEIKETIKEEKIKEVEEVKEEIEKELDPEIFDKVFEITVKYLSAFGETIFDNIRKELKIKKEKVSLSLFRKFVNELTKSAQMIVGPSKSKNMKEEILKLIE